MVIATGRSSGRGDGILRGLCNLCGKSGGAG